MGSAPGQPAVLQDKNLVCVEYRGDALGNDDLGGVRKAFASPSRIFASVAVSTALVESSRIRTLGLLK